VLAGLVANGERVIELYHIDEGIVEKLCGVGAAIERLHG
jgi:UDP-N-acetylglucosamine enolpyruvyl transferase